MIAFPNAKINLGLNVLRRREDGYHDISTVFVPYKGLSDVLEVVFADEPVYLERTRALAGRCFEFTDFIVRKRRDYRCVHSETLV